MQDAPVRPSAAPSTPPAFPPRPDTARPGGIFVRIAVAATVVLVLAMLAVIFIKDRRVPEPTSAIMIYGDPSLDGTKIVVTSLDDPSRPPVTTTLNETNKYQIPIYRLPGRYGVSITWHNTDLMQEPIILTRLRSANIELPTVVTIIGDASFAGAEATIESADASVYPERGQFSAGNKYRLTVVRPAGKYDLTITRGGAQLFSNSFAVAPHTAKEI